MLLVIELLPHGKNIIKQSLCGETLKVFLYENILKYQSSPFIPTQSDS